MGHDADGRGGKAEAIKGGLAVIWIVSNVRLKCNNHRGGRFPASTRLVSFHHIGER